MSGKLARRHFSQLSEFDRGLIIGMKTAGCSTHRVAGQVDRTECAVRNCWEQWTREDTHVQKTGSGATRKTTRREDRRTMRQALVDPTVTRSDVGVAIVPQTISRQLVEANLKFKRPFRALPLTPEHRQLLLQWCQARSMWNVTDWQKVVFSDESWFVLGTDYNRVRVWRHPDVTGEQLTDFDRGASEKQVGNRRIGRPLGRSDMVVARYWQQWITEGRVYRRGGSGRPRNTNDREDRAIRRVATSAPTTSLASIQTYVSAIKRNRLREPTSLQRTHH
ncbi:transposable element Tc1 transposase [Trichonephila clavipes]|nr:transposable element Tc1 transposase [Trichonephila clavipes]